MSNPLVQVLNTDTCRIVMLPLANKGVINQGKVFHHLSTNIPAIDDLSYQALVELLDLPSADINLTRNYFVERCLNFVGEDKPLVSSKGYGFIFSLLSDAGFNLKCMLERLSHIIYSWYEEDSADVLSRIYGDSDDTVVKVSAIDVIKAENVTEAFVTSYQDGEKSMILYCDSALKLTA